VTDKVPGARQEQPDLSPLDAQARHRGRMGLAISWETIPWWGIIILIIGVIVTYSVLTNARYQDAIYFIFDLPWNRQTLGTVEVGDDGTWSITVQPALSPGTYTLYGEFQNADEEIIGQSETYKVRIPRNAAEGEAESVTTPSYTAVVVNTTTPTISGTGPQGATVVLTDDFSSQPLRVARRMFLAKGIFLTIRVTLIAFAGALILGLMFGIMRVSSKSPDLRINAWKRLLFGLGIIALLLLTVPEWRNLNSLIWVVLITEAIMFLLPAMPYTVSTLYVEIVRGVPMLVIILYMGFAVTPLLRDASDGAIDLRGLPAAVIGLAFGYGAYLAEVFRAGIQSIPKGQMEAARALGMSYPQSMRYVILPQAIRVVLPPLGNDFIAMLKDSALISVIALPEVLQQGRLWISRNFRAFEGFNSVAMLYLVMTLLLSLLVRFIERKTKLPGGQD